MVATARGIYHNLLESKYIISNDDIVYFFSSELYRNKFLSEYKQNRLKMSKHTSKLWDKHKIDVGLDFTALHDLILYRSIEKRGMRINFMGVDLSWQEAILFAQRRMIEPNTNDYKATSIRKLIEQKRITV